MIRHWPLVLKNGLRNKRRTTLTVCSIAVSLCVLGVFLAIYHSFYFTDATPEQAFRLVTRNKVSLAQVMPTSYRQKIEQVSGVREVMVMQWYGGEYKDPKNMFARMAIEPARFFAMFPEIKLAEEQKLAFQRERSACLLGRELAEKFNLKVGDRVTLKGDIFPGTLEFTVRGVYDNTRRPADEMFFNIQYLYESLPQRRRDFAGTFAVLADSPDSVPRVAREIDALFRNSPVQTKTETEREFELSFISFLGNVKAFLLSVCGAVTFTILLVSANTMAMSVRERVKEVGILKTLGFTRGAIMGIILGEAALIALLGGILGWCLALLLTEGLRYAPVMIGEIKMLTLRLSVTVALLAASLIIGIASALIPAWGASRTTIVDAMRHSG